LGKHAHSTSINQSINQAVLLLQLNSFATKPTKLSSEFHFRRPKKSSQEGRVGVSSQNYRSMIKNIFLVYSQIWLNLPRDGRVVFLAV
jgi:hypothetical protein